MIKNNSQEYTPLRMDAVKMGTDSIWQKGGRSWFFLELDTGLAPLITADGLIFRTAKNERLVTKTKYRKFPEV